MALHLFLSGVLCREFIKPSFWNSDLMKGNILFRDMPICSQLSFESAAIIGEYFSLQKEVFVDLLGDKGNIKKDLILKGLKDFWDLRYINIGLEPHDFTELLADSERTRIIKMFGNNYGNKKIPIVSFMQYLAMPVLMEAFGCGLYNPILVRKLWYNSYETKLKKEDIDLGVKYGVISKEDVKSLEPKSLTERQNQLLSICKVHVSSTYPEYLNILNWQTPQNR